MTQVVSSLSGIQFYAPSAGHAPTNSGDVSAIASAYQVVSSTGTQLYAGTDYVTGVNGAPLSASRAGNAANASLASSAWYDGTGRLISSLPDGTEVSSIASSYAGSAASSKLDTSAFSSVSGTFLTSVDLTPYQEKTGMSAYALSGDVSGVIDTVSSNSATWGQGGVDSATVSAIASSYVESGVSGKLDSSSLGIDDFDHQVSSISGMAISAWHAELAAHADSAEYWRGESGKQDVSAMSSYALSSDVSGVIDTVSSNSATWGGGATGDYVEKSAVTLGIGLLNNVSSSSLAHGSSNSARSNSFAQGTKNSAVISSLAQGNVNSAVSASFAQGWSNLASGTSFSQGVTNRAYGYTFAQGMYNSAGDYSFAQGRACSASSTSFAQGRLCSAKDVSLAQGYGVSSMRSATVFGQWNRDGDGWGEKGVAFGIGDGTASGSRHDLMTLQKNGEITVYSSTSDVTGTGILSAIRAISAAATGGGAAFPASIVTGTNVRAVITTGFQDNTSTRPTLFISGTPTANAYPRMLVSENHTAGTTPNKSSTYLSDAFELYTAAAGNNPAGTKVLRIDSAGLHGNNWYFTDWEYSVWNGAASAVSSNSSHWNVGVNAATCSSIASSYAKSAASGVIDTVSSNSASWGQGGVDSATVSSIASSYVESGVSGKLDSSASSSFYTTANESGFITGVDLSPYQTTADMSGYIPTSMSSDFQQASAMSSYALSSDVSGTVDLVSTQSANWGGSALQMSAGPGVKLEKSGNVLVASTDETVLWSQTAYSYGMSSVTLSESYKNFEVVKVYTNKGDVVYMYPDNSQLVNTCSLTHFNGSNIWSIPWTFTDDTHFDGAAGVMLYSDSGTMKTITVDASAPYGRWEQPQKIIGINRTAEA